MGSGYSGIYSGHGSQPYAPTYHVVPSMMKLDKANPDIYDSKTGYFLNPTATNLETAINGDRVVMGGRTVGDKLTYVMDTNGHIIIGKRCNPNNSKGRAPHPTLIGGKNPEIQCAGIIHFHKGRIVSVDTDSGHFRPSSKSLEKVTDVLDKLYAKHPNAFDKNSKWRK